jgi:hypothetical protein
LKVLTNFPDTKLAGKDFEQLLKLVRRARVKDEKDKVYGIIALLNDAIANQIQPAYSESVTVREVYQNFTISIITTTKSLDQILFGGSIESGWPTWVTDLRTPFERLHVKQLRRSGLHDRKARDGKLQGSEFEVPRIINGTTLACKGYDIDTIEAIGASSSFPHIDQSRSDRPRYGEFTSEALARTLVMSHTRSKNPLVLLSIPWKSPLNVTPSSTDAILQDSWDRIYMTGPYKEFHEFRNLNKELIIERATICRLFPRTRTGRLRAERRNQPFALGHSVFARTTMDIWD